MALQCILYKYLEVEAAHRHSPFQENYELAHHRETNNKGSNKGVISSASSLVEAIT